MGENDNKGNIYNYNYRINIEYYLFSLIFFNIIS